MPSLLTLSGSGNAIMLLGRPSAPYESPQIQRRSCFGWVGNAGLCYPRSAPPAGGDGPELLELAEAACAFLAAWRRAWASGLAESPLRHRDGHPPWASGSTRGVC